MTERKPKRKRVPSPPSSDDDEQFDDDGDEIDDGGGDEIDDVEDDGDYDVDDNDDEDSGTENTDDSENSDEDESHESENSNEDESDESESRNEDEESLCNRVIRLLQEGCDLESLNLKESKAYLRKHGLRVTGTKAVCAQRIQEHWRIKDGNGELLYPRSSFNINCTGDVCKGDIVLFTQKVYAKFNKVKRRGNVIGKRTVAGRVVKESYGAAKQQHTFTVEVLWSKGMKKLPPLSPLLVKGRNLYRMRTFRRCWNDEAERRKVLDEKHRRGTAARLVRATRNQPRKTLSSNGGKKRKKPENHLGPSRTRRTNEPEKKKKKRVDGHGKATRIGNEKSRKCHPKPPPEREVNTKRNTNPRGNKTRMGFSHKNEPSNPNYNVGSTSTSARLPLYRPYIDPHETNALRNQEFNNRIYTHHGYSHPGYEFGRRDFNGFPEPVNYDRARLFPSFPSVIEMNRQRSSEFSRCSTFGCHGVGSQTCMVSSCRECCIRTRRRCIVHQSYHPF